MSFYRRDTHKRHLKLYSLPPHISSYIPPAPLSQRFPCSTCWMPGLHLVTSINAVLKRKWTQRRQPRQPPQERRMKQQVGNAAPLTATVHHNVLERQHVCDSQPVPLSPVQRCLPFKCVPQCSRCPPVTTAEVAADTPPCPTTTRSFCSTPSIRVSWSPAESLAK